MRTYSTYPFSEGILVWQYEPVGGLQIAALHAVGMEGSWENKEERFKARGIHVGSLKSASGEGQRQRRPALQWSMGMGIGKEAWNKKFIETKINKVVLWSISSSLKELWQKAYKKSK